MKKTSMALLVCCLMFSGCMSAQRSQLLGIAKDYKVTLYSGGTAVKEYVSSGKVLTEQQSDGYFFTDKSTGKLIRLSGTMVIEEQ
jgi:hypothetical protein